MVRDREPPLPALAVGQKAFLGHLGRLVAEQGSLLGSGGKRVAFNVNAKGELVIAIIVQGTRLDG